MEKKKLMRKNFWLCYRGCLFKEIYWNWWLCRNCGYITWYIQRDIVNPYTGGKRLYVMNRTRSYMKNSSASITGSLGVDCVVIDDYMTDLKK